MKRTSAIEAAFLMLGLLICGCAAPSGLYKIEKVQGRKVGKITYTDYETLEAKLRKKYKDDMDFEVEKKMLPRGGNLYILDKKYFMKNPLVYAEVSDGASKAKCDDFEISTSNMAVQHMSQGAVAVPVGPSITVLNKTKTEIDCKVDAKIRFPAMIYFVAMNFDTVATYSITKVETKPSPR